MNKNLESRFVDYKSNLNNFQDIYNPLKMFHNLVGIGVTIKQAKEISQRYETLFYRPLNKFVLERR